MTGGTRLRVRAARAEELAAAEVDAWRDLEERALEPNAYLSPDFVLPALRHLDPGHAALCVMVESADAGSPARLRGLGVFVARSPSLAFPLRHLAGYASAHSYRGGLLLDAERPVDALRPLLRFVAGEGGRFHGLLFRDMRVDGPVADALRACGASPAVLDRKPRAVLVPREDSASIAGQMSGSRQKAFRRRLRKIGEAGAVSWTAHRSAETAAACIERHLALEHQGWKLESGSSLLSTPEGAAFFREAFGAFGSRGRAVFTELSLDGRVVASTSNLISGCAGFAFKLGWESSLASLAPGKVNEIYFLRESPRVFAGIEWLDSGAAPGSFIEQLWLERHDLARVIVPLTLPARLAVAAIDQLRRTRKGLRRLSARRAPPPPAPTRAGADQDGEP